MGLSLTNSESALVTDRQVDSKSKTNGQPIFSASGKPPGNNHRKNGGNLLFVDGHTDWSPPQASFSIVLTQGIVLLNPKP
jgi:prepilin-type processing-associated H-X9-DG protein